MEDLTMESKKQDKKQVKKQPLTALPVVTLSEKDMSSVSGGGSSWN
jgi:bacteriocin-like protein